MSRPFICENCGAEGEATDAYCNECGWDGVIFAFDQKYPPGSEFEIEQEDEQ